MSIMVLLLLAGLWAAILLPGVLRARREHSPLATVDRFERSMGVLAPEVRAEVIRLAVEAPVPEKDHHRRRTPPGERRRQVLTAFGAGGSLTGLLAMALGGPFVWAFVIVLLALAMYLGLLLHMLSRAEHTRRTVRRLPGVQDPSRPESGSISEVDDARSQVAQAVGSTTVRVRHWEG